jgi:hypothetical protein
MTLYNWIRLLVTLGLVLLLFLCSAGIFGRRAATGAVTAPGASITAPITTGFAITEPLASAQLAAGGFTLKGTGTPGEQLSIFEDGTNLGSTVVREDGSWAYDVPGPSAGDHTYEARGSGDPATVSVNIAQAEARTGDCTKDYSLSVKDGDTLAAPFRFGGAGKGAGYTVKVKRGERQIGTKDLGLDNTCEWSYQSNPGPGAITYEVQELGGGATLSTVNLNIQ